MFGWDRVQGKAASPYYVKSWHNDPRIRGGYSSLPVGIDHEALLRNSKPLRTRPIRNCFSPAIT